MPANLDIVLKISSHGREQKLISTLVFPRAQHVTEIEFLADFFSIPRKEGSFQATDRGDRSGQVGRSDVLAKVCELSNPAPKHLSP